MLRQTSTYMLAHGVTAVLGFTFVVLFTRLLTPEQYGLYVVGMGLAGILSAVLYAWIRVSILRFESEGRADVRFTAMVGLALSTIAVPVLIFGTTRITGDPVSFILLAVLVAVGLGVFDFGQEILRARQQPGAYARGTIVRAVLGLAISFVLVQLGFGGAGLLIGISCAYVLSAVFSSRTVWRGPIAKFDPVMFRRMLRYGLPMAFSGIVFALHGALDRLVVSYVLGDAAAGEYGATADLTRQIILFPAFAVGSALVPLVIRSFADSGEKVALQNLARLGEFILAALVPAVVGLALVAPQMSGIILGEEFRETAATLIPILAFAWLFHALSQHFIQVSFHLAEKPALLLLHDAFILGANAIAMFILIPRFQLMGAAWGFVISEVIGLAFGFVLTRFAYGVHIQWASLIKVVAATTFMAVPTMWIINLEVENTFMKLSGAIICGLVTYGVAAFALNLADLRTATFERFSR